MRPRAWVAGALCLAGLSAGVPPRGRPQRPWASTVGYYVSPTVDTGGTGTEEHPWSLSTALVGAGGRLQPGDTVWLRGGTYRGAFRTELHGLPGQLIVFRQHPGERATIDGTLRADGAYLAFWGFEIMQSIPGTYGLQANTAHGRFINLVVHDAGNQGVSFWTPAIDAELYGNIIYNNGTHENLDHGVYVHNEVGTKVIADNVFFNNLARGIQIYASPKNPAIRNIRVEGNVSFNNGTISTVVPARQNLIFNAPVLTEGMVGIGNLLYFSGPDGVNLRVGRFAAANNRDLVLRDNYAAGGRVGLEMIEPWQQATVTGNVFIGSGEVVQVGGQNLTEHYQWTNNTWARDAHARAWRHAGTRYNWENWRRATGLGDSDQVLPASPRETKVFVRPNRYEAGRAHIVVYNWGMLSEVAIDVTGVLKEGDRYEVRNVQAVFGPPVAEGVYQGGSIHVPMAGVAPPAPLGRVAGTPPRTGPAFDVFLLTTASR